MAQKKVNGITIAINADTNGVTSGLKELTTQSVSLTKQLKSVEAALKMDPTDTEMLTLKQQLLAESVETTRKRLEALRGAQEDVKKAVESGSIGTDEYIAFQKELIETEKRMKDLENIATSFQGIDKAYAISAGREIRVIVEPKQIDDLSALKLARDIANKIEATMSYPGIIKVNVIRETRAVEYAK